MDNCVTPWCRCPLHDPAGVHDHQSGNPGSLAHRKSDTTCRCPAFLGIKNEAAGRRRGTAAPAPNRRLFAGSKRKPTKRKMASLATCLRLPADSSGRHGAVAMIRRPCCFLFCFGAALDAAHASRHTWRASGARKASIGRKDLSWPHGSEKSRIHWL